MTNYNTIEISVNKSVFKIILNRPEVHNAMNAELIAELTEVFKNINTQKDIAAVVLSGNGKSFCAGADLNYMKGIAEFGEEENINDAKKLAALFMSVYKCPKPTIAMVHGAVFGGANGLISACDIVIAEENTTFAFSEVKLGIAPATIAPFVVKRIGEFGSKELMMTGKRFKSMEALKWNLVNHVYNKETDENPLDKILKEFHSSAPKAVMETKILIEEVLNNSLDSNIEYTTNLIAKLRASDEGQEGMSAFLEKRKPDYGKSK